MRTADSLRRHAAGMLRGAVALASLTLGLGGGNSAGAADGPGRLRLELNRLEAQGESCRAYLLINNAGSEAFKSFKLDLFALDTDGVAQRRLALEVGPIAAKKTLIKLFDFPGMPCERFGSVLLSGVLSCEAGSGPREDCLAAIETTSKVASVPFAQ